MVLLAMDYRSETTVDIPVENQWSYKFNLWVKL